MRVVGAIVAFVGGFISFAAAASGVGGVLMWIVTAVFVAGFFASILAFRGDKDDDDYDLSNIRAFTAFA